MKKKKWIMPAFCLLLLALLVAVYFLLKNQNKESEATENKEDSVIVTNIDADHITEISFKIEEEIYTFEKQEEEWKLEGEGEFPLDSSQIDTLINNVSSLEASRKLENLVDLSEYGLEDPKNTISLTTSDEVVTTLNIGNKNSTTSNTYVNLGEKHTAYVVSTNFSSLLPETKMDLAKGEDFPVVTASAITHLSVIQGEKEIILEKEEDSGAWKLTDEQGQTSSADSDKISTLESGIAGLQFLKLVDYKMTNPGKYGLDEPAMILHVKYTETVPEDSSEQEEESTVTEEKEFILKVGDVNEEGDYYVNLEGSSEVHIMSAESLESMMDIQPEEYWEMDIGVILETKISGLSVEYQNQTTDIERREEKTIDEEENEETTIHYYSGDKEIDSSVFSRFYNKLIVMEAQSKSQELVRENEPDMRVIFHTDEGDKTVTYTSYNENFYLAEDIEGRCGLVGKQSVKELFDKFEELRDSIS